MKKLVFLFVLFVFVISACDLAGESIRGVKITTKKASVCDVNEAVGLVFRMVSEGASNSKIENALNKIDCDMLNKGVKVRRR